jgi:hypothetical protein
MTNIIESTSKPSVATNSFRAPTAIDWRNFTDTLAEALTISPDLVAYAAESLAIAASPLKALGLATREIDHLIDKLNSVKVTLDHVEAAVCELLERDPSQWAKADPDIAA